MSSAEFYCYMDFLSFFFFCFTSLFLRLLVLRNNCGDYDMSIEVTQGLSVAH